MDLIKAKELVKFDLESANVIIVLSNKSVWKLDNENEILAVEEYAKNNKLEMFIVKKGEVISKDVVSKDEPKKKK